MKTEKNLVPQSLSALVPSREKAIFTLAEGATQVAPSKVCRKGAFTLAEVLITLAVVGVVAILVMPKLLDNVADRKYDAARKKALATIGEAVKQITIEGEVTSAADAEDFVKNYLSKKLSIVKTCANNKLKECGFSDTYTTAWGNTLSIPLSVVYGLNYHTTWVDSRKNNSFGFVMSNGYSVNLFYNPNCVSFMNIQNAQYTGHDNICVNAIYDMHGQAKPNKVGKDIGFVSVIYPDETVKAFAPLIAEEDFDSPPGFSYDEAIEYCSSRGFYLPNTDEALAIHFNKVFATGVNSMYMQSSTPWPLNPEKSYWMISATRWGSSKNSSYGVTCVKK